MDTNPVKKMKSKSEKKTKPIAKKKKSKARANRKKSVFSSLYDFLFRLVLLGIGTITLLCVILQYAFPGKLLAPTISKSLTQVLKVPVNIKSIDFQLLDGLQISKLDIGIQHPIVKINKINIDYDLLALIGGNLMVQQILIDRPEFFLNESGGRWNFERILESLQGSSPAKPDNDIESPSSEIKIPKLPIGIEIRRAAIQNLRFNARLEDGTIAGIYGLSLNAKVKALKNNLSSRFGVFMSPAFSGSAFNVYFESTGAKKVKLKTQVTLNAKFSQTGLTGGHLTAIFGVKRTQLQLEEKQIVPDLFAQTNINLFSKPQLLNLNSLIFKIGKHNTVSLKGHISDFIEYPKFKIQMKPMSFNVDEIMQWLHTFESSVSAKGRIDIKGFSMQGSAPRFVPENLEISPIGVATRGLSVSYQPLQAAIDEINTNIETSKLTFKNGLPQDISANIDLKIEKGSSPEFSFSKLNNKLNFSTDDTQLSNASADWDLSLGRVQVNHPQTGDIETDLHVKGNVSGSLANGDFDKLNVSYSIGSVLSGKTEGNIQDFGKSSFTINQNLEVDLQKTLELIPAKFLKDFKQLEMSGKVNLLAKTDGALDSDFAPKEIQLSAKTHWDKTSINIQSPVKASLADSSGKVKFLVDYDPRKGVKVDSLKLNASWNKAKALGKWAADSANIDLKLGMGKFLNAAHPKLIPIQLKTNIDIGSISGAEPAVNASDIVIKADAKGSFKTDDFRNAHLKGELSLKNAAGLNIAEVKSLHSKFKVLANDMNLEQTDVNIEGKLKSPSLKTEELNASLSALDFKAVSRQNLKKGNFEIDSVLVQSPKLLNFEMKGKADEWGKSFSAQGILKTLELAPLLDLAPEKLKKSAGNPSMSGTLSANFNLNGNLPEKFEIAKSKLPIKGNVQVKLENASANLPVQSIKTSGLNLIALVDTDGENANLSGEISARKLFMTKLMDKTSIDPAYKFEYQLDNFNALELRKHQFEMKGLGFKHTAKGRIEGFKPFITQESRPEPSELLKRLTLIMSVENSVEVEKALQNPSVEFPEKSNLTAKGSLHSNINLQIKPGEKINLDGQAEFDKFILNLKPDLQAGEINGKFVFNKELFLDRSLATIGKRKFFASKKGFFSQLRDYSNYKNIIQIKSLKFQDKQISNIGIDLFYKDNNLMAEKFLLDVLNGSVGGSFALESSPQGPTLKLSSEFSGIDMGALLKDKTGLTGKDSQIDGRQSFKMVLGKNSASVGLDQIDAEIEITHIGAETLDRLLLSIDPEESKPAIADIRSKLKLASPHRALITIKNGNLGVQAWLKNKLLGGIIKAPELKRVPLSSLQEFEQISKALEGLKNIQNLLKYISAQGVEFDKEGKIHFY